MVPIFWGSIDFEISVTNRFMLGPGIQYAESALHNDNGWVLTRLHFLPVYLNTSYAFCSSCFFQSYIHTEEGISFNRYNKLDTAVSHTPFKVAEQGLYLSVNAGTNVATVKDVNLFTEFGYKGFKHSLNDLDVNPHGFTARAGIAIK